MFKIAKRKIHRRKFTSRSSLSLKRASYAHHNLLELIERFQRSPARNILILRKFFEDDVQKNHVKKWILEDDYAAFDTAWEGALKLAYTIEKETCTRSKLADHELLLKDLNALKNYLLTPSVC